jgi:hypothetical protein
LFFFRYEAGIDKLKAAAVVVTDTQERLRQLQPDLLATSTETAELLAAVEKQKNELDSRRKVNRGSG